MLTALYQLSESDQEFLPVYQSLYSFDHKYSAWSPVTPTSNRVDGVSEFAVITWNIDFTAPLRILRFETLLSHLEHLLSPIESQPLPTIILLQEVHKSCLPTLLSNTFIRAMYHVTDVSTHSWNCSYGTITLIPKCLSMHVAAVFRTPFSNSIMGRDALYIDFDLPHPCQSFVETMKTKVRVANTHLESLPGHGDKVRTDQLTSISQSLSSPDVDGGLVGGDMNAISPSDFNLPEEVGLLDAWTMGMKDPDDGRAAQAELGHTWGYQPRSKFPPNRLDKILFVGCLRVAEMKRIGVGLKVSDGNGREGLNAWVSDHYGLQVKVVVV